MNKRTFEYNLSKFIGILFPKTANIFYECSAHLNQNYFKTILAMFRIITIFKVDYSMSYESGYSVICWHFGRSKVGSPCNLFIAQNFPYCKKLISISTKEWKRIVEKYSIEFEEKYYCGDIFVAGHNVVYW